MSILNGSSAKKEVNKYKQNSAMDRVKNCSVLFMPFFEKDAMLNRVGNKIRGIIVFNFSID